jgi:molybdopterin-guanine dinucleotide biosynthesis protein A
MTERPRTVYVLVGPATRLPGKFDLPVGGIPLLDRVLGAARASQLTPTIVTSGTHPRPGVPTLEDRYDRGPLGGVRTIVEHDPSPFVLVAGDMPYVTAEGFAQLVRWSTGARTTVPRWPDGTLEVLFAVYDLDPPRVQARWDAGGSLRSLALELHGEGQARFVDAEAFPAGTFVDVDTPDDWERVRDRSAPLPGVPGPRTGGQEPASVN